MPHTQRESSDARRAWADYFSLGDKRSISALWTTYRERIDNGDTTVPCRNIQRLKQWSASFHWVDRLEKIDLEASQREERNQIQLLESARVRHRIESLSIGEALRARAREMLKFPLVEEQYQKDGKTIIIKPMKWTAGDIVRFAQTADVMVRLALGMSSESKPVDIEDMIRKTCRLNGLTPEETEEAVRVGLEQWETEMKALHEAGAPQISPPDDDMYKPR